jgi:TrmH family RNA methyltransferase
LRLLTLARDLQRRKARERQHLFVAEGIRAVEELLRSSIPVRGALVAPILEHTPRGLALRETLGSRGIEILAVADAELASAADTESPQGIVAIAQIPQRTLHDVALGPRSRLLVLDAIQDPGNAGTLLRTAAALGVEATLALPGTVDLWNAKVVRSAMGALFQRPAISCTWEALDQFLGSTGFPLWGADAAGEPLSAVTTPDRLALVVGNEGSGLTPQASARLGRRVAIPLASDIESLNVAVAAGILLYQLRP